MTPQQVWCVVEDDLKESLEEQFKNWGWKCAFVTRPAAGMCPEDKRILTTDDSWVEDWAFNVLATLQGEAEPLLIAQSELMPKNRVAGHGILLSERVWSSRVIPTIIATVNPQVGQNRSVRRIRLSSGKPLLRVVRHSEPTSSELPDLVLWDILLGRKEFTESIERARQTFKDSQRLDKQSSNSRSTSEQLQNAAVAMQTAAYRHSLKGFMASLRIMEGAYLCNWISSSEIDKMLDELIVLSRGDVRRSALLDKLKGRFKNLVQRTCSMPIHRPGNNQLKVVVCDDDWERAGWNNLIKSLLYSRFGLEVDGCRSQAELLAMLNTTRDRDRIVTLLLDVHYEDESRETGRVDRQFLRRLHEEYPLLDVILFTSDLHDGALVREAYERGYRLFFKEMDESARKPEQDTRKFIQVVEDSVSTFPIRAVQQVVEAGVADRGADDAVSAFLEAIATWRRDANPAMVFNLATLLEREYRVSYARVAGKTMNPNTSVGWNALSDKCDPRSEAAQTWMRFYKLATTARNSLLHNAGLVLEANSTLPSLGLAVPIVMSITSLHRIFTGDSAQNRRPAMLPSLVSLCRAIYMSNQIKKSDSRTFLETAMRNLISRKAEDVYKNICDLSAKNEKLMGKVTPPKGTTTLTSCLHDRDLFFEPVIEVNGKKVNCPLSLSDYQFTCVLTTACLLDHAEATF